MLPNNLLFPTFLDHKKIYNLAEAWWRRRFDHLFTDPKLRYHRFYNNRYVNGEKCYDGNPLFDAYFPGRHKLIRIIQDLPEEGDIPLGAWTDYWPMAEMDEDQKPQPADPAQFDQPIPELVLALSLNRSIIPLADQLLLAWIVDDLSRAEMEKMIDDVIAEMADNDQ